MINTGMWIQGRFLGRGVGRNQLEQMLVRIRCAQLLVLGTLAIGGHRFHLSPALQDQASCLLQK
jgi:hypothetical protein